MSNQQIEALAAATEALQELIVLLRHGPAT
jgi:hypothetical protein